MASVSFIDPETGRTKRRRRRARTKAQASEYVRQMIREVADYGNLPEASRTVATTLDDYLSVRAAADLGHGARVSDQWATDLIRRGLGDRSLTALSVKDCDDFLAGAAAGRFSGPLGRDQLKRLRGRLIRAIENDRRRGYITRNVAELAVIPEVSPLLKPRRERRVISHDQLRSLIEHASPITALLIDLSGRHGLRPAEARGLRWSRVDLRAMTVRIDAQINRRNEIVKAKTKRSVRTIRIDVHTVTRFATWRDHQAAAEQHAGPAWSGNQLDLIATTAFGTAINQRNVHRSLARASNRANVAPAVSGYDLRHTAITYQVEKGYPVHQIADWAGTSERMIIDVYRHKLTDVTDLGPAV